MIYPVSYKEGFALDQLFGHDELQIKKSLKLLRNYYGKSLVDLVEKLLKKSLNNDIKVFQKELNNLSWNKIQDSRNII